MIEIFRPTQPPSEEAVRARWWEANKAAILAAIQVLRVADLICELSPEMAEELEMMAKTIQEKALEMTAKVIQAKESKIEGKEATKSEESTKAG